jgi:threonine/homoserine/homoserine lactone efflux protein
MGRCVYLCWLALEFWKSDAELAEMELEKRSSEKNAFISGMLVTLGNPKSVLFYISIMPTIVNLRSITQMDALALLVTTAGDRKDQEDPKRENRPSLRTLG